MQDIEGRRYAAGSQRQMVVGSQRWHAAGVWTLILAMGLVPCVLHAQTTTAQQEQRERAQRQAQQREALRSAPDVRLSGKNAFDYRLTTVPSETPCFRIDVVQLEGAHRKEFGFVQKYLDAYRGQCLGQEGLRLLAHRASDVLLARGYVTSRLVIPAQNLASGRLRVVLLAGTVGAVRFAPGSARADWRSALPIRPGDVLNLRAIEQGLEQLKRVPSQDARIDIAPGTQPNTSDLVLTVRRGKRWRIIANLDDSGATSTGKEQGGLTLAVDQPLGINDLLSIGYTHSAGNFKPTKGTHGGNINYSVPWGNWTFSLSSSHYAYRQTVFGSLQTFAYTGTSSTTAASAMRLLHRDARSRTSLELTVATRNEHSYIDSVQIQTQRRQVTSAELALIQRRYLGHSQLDLRLAYRWGVPWLGGDWQAGVAGGPTHRYGFATLDASLSTPFLMISTPWVWLSELHVQATGDHLYAEDDLTLGGRYTVRGYDGNTVLAGRHGYYWRNTLNLPIGSTGAQLYGGMDVGHVGGDSISGYASHSLSGAVLGVRGSRWGLSWDLFAGWPLQAPRGFPVRRPTAGMQWIYTY
ncbi:ShlB/FhaC/HecB family hemolysin secretion/activation protein [Dyella sp. A6]|uniref:ShlB/FhaC/HecB family hemolysin secretion/activation protein n=1 Tax=Dyella aluminiiresistens TaxID=3069105 RepID=UPI002E762E58|nr:ShlB/FhaC/HecB family hemolysin secretion/activation protein [Dyella sp. A6]